MFISCSGHVYGPYLFLSFSRLFHCMLMSCVWYVNDLFITSSRLVDSFFMTYPWLVYKLFMTCSQLHHKFVHDFSWRGSVHKLFMTSYNLFITWPQLFLNFLMTCLWFLMKCSAFINFLTCKWLLNDLIMNYAFFFYDLSLTYS